MESHKKTLGWIKKNPDKAAEMTQKETGLPMDGGKVLTPWYDFDSSVRKEGIQELNRTQNFNLEDGLQRNKIDVNSIILR